MKNLSNGTFVPRKDPTRLARIEAAKLERQRTAIELDDDASTQPIRDEGGSPKRQKPKYYGHSPARSAGRNTRR